MKIQAYSRSKVSKKCLFYIHSYINYGIFIWREFYSVQKIFRSIENIEINLFCWISKPLQTNISEVMCNAPTLSFHVSEIWLTENNLCLTKNGRQRCHNHDFIYFAPNYDYLVSVWELTAEADWSKINSSCRLLIEEKRQIKRDYEEMISF